MADNNNNRFRDGTGSSNGETLGGWGDGSGEWSFSRVETYMTPDPVCCLPSDSLTQAAMLMRDEDCGAIPVVLDKEGREPIGIITDRDIVCRAVAKEKDPSKVQVEECMSSDPAAVTPDTTITEALDLMEERKIRRILVVDDNNGVCGVVAQADIALLGSDEKTAEIVREVSEPGAHPTL